MTFIDATLSATSAATSTGLATLDFWALRTSSKIIHLILTQLSNNVFIASMTTFIRRISLSVWLSKHPQRQCSESDNIISCHQALLYLGLTLLSFNFIVVIIGWAIISIYSLVSLSSILSQEHLHPTWFSFFTTVCAVNQAGFTLVEEGLLPFSNRFFFAFILSIIILISNTLLPVVMRGIITLFARFSKKPDPWKFLLEHPRICSTLLFPALQTKILAGTTNLLLFNYLIILL